ncbi:hypothetical protein E5288_WYG020105 [Bos mutus]|uniref:Uncharacterized protein n=1 Tax=Bos mutus TaxID=72004 RepID=A0A6B0S9N2_9CETA|nr:hypothetical protein [Bos mutus]
MINVRQIGKNTKFSLQRRLRNVYNVDDNGRDALQPSLFSTYRDMVNIQQLCIYNKMSQALRKSSSSNNYQSIYGGVRRYSDSKTGYTVEGDSNLMKHQEPESSNKDSKRLVSNLDLVTFLEPLKDPRNIRRMGTTAIYPGVSPQDTQDLIPKNPALEGVFPKGNLGICQTFHLGNLNLLKDREYTRVNERQRGYLYGHKQMEIVIHNANVTAKRNEQRESNLEKHQVQSSTSAEKCKCLRKNAHRFLKNKSSLKGNMENLKGNLVFTTNTVSDNSEGRLRLNMHSSMSEYLQFNNERTNSQFNQFEGSVSRGSFLFPQEIFSLHSKMYNVDDNERDAIQPSLFSTYRDTVNTQQLCMYNKMSQTLSKSSSSNNYRSIYGGVRRYSGSETGSTVEGDSNLMKHRGPESSNKDSKSKTFRNTFDKMARFSLDKSTCSEERTFREYGLVVSKLYLVTFLEQLNNPRSIRRMETTAIFPGLVVSKLDLVTFLEQMKEPRNIRTMKTVAVYPGLVSKLDLVTFLEQLKDSRNIRRMETTAIYPGEMGMYELRKKGFRIIHYAGLVSKVDLVTFLELLKDPRNMRRMEATAIYPGLVSTLDLVAFLEQLKDPRNTTTTIYPGLVGSKLDLITFLEQLNDPRTISRMEATAIFPGLVGSKLDLITFLEQLNDPRNIRRMETTAIFPLDLIIFQDEVKDAWTVNQMEKTAIHPGLVVSKVDLVTFLEQMKDPRNISRMETMAMYPGVSLLHNVPRQDAEHEEEEEMAASQERLRTISSSRRRSSSFPLLSTRVLSPDSANTGEVSGIDVPSRPQNSRPRRPPRPEAGSELSQTRPKPRVQPGPRLEQEDKQR